MFYINDETYQKLLASAERVNTKDPYGLQKRLSRYPVIRYWDGGETIGASSGQWEEQARLIDAGVDFLFLELQEVYWGQSFGDKPPKFYKVNKSAYEELLTEEQQNDPL